MNKPIAIIDSREKAGKEFDLGFYGFETIKRKLQTGDYSLEGYEDFISIDRKASVVELAQNLFYGYKRFKAEMIRASSITNFFLVLEFPIEYVLIFPAGSGIPRKKWQGLRATPSGIYHKLDLIYTNYGVKTIFCENKQAAEEKTVELLNIAIDNGSYDSIEFFRKP